VETEYLAVHPADETKSNKCTSDASDKKVCHIYLTDGDGTLLTAGRQRTELLVWRQERELRSGLVRMGIQLCSDLINADGGFRGPKQK
jgi:hypothetical protein